MSKRPMLAIERIRVGRVMAVGLLGLGAAVLWTNAQSAASGPIVNFTATTDNVAGAHDSIRINLLRWSTDAERDQLTAAWNMTGAAAPPARGGARAPAGGEGGAPAAGANAGAARGGGARGGGGGRGGRGRGGEPAEAAPTTPEATLKAAIDKAPTIGYVWSSEVAGYAIRYAVKLPAADGGERIILITDRRLGAWNNEWKPASSDPATTYEFTLLELHVNSKGEGEGKASLTTKISFDAPSKSLALENYASSPVILKAIKRRTS